MLAVDVLLDQIFVIVRIPLRAVFIGEGRRYGGYAAYCGLQPVVEITCLELAVIVTVQAEIVGFVPCPGNVYELIRSIAASYGDCDLPGIFCHIEFHEIIGTDVCSTLHEFALFFVVYLNPDVLTLIRCERHHKAIMTRRESLNCLAYRGSFAVAPCVENVIPVCRGGGIGWIREFFDPHLSFQNG